MNLRIVRRQSATYLLIAAFCAGMMGHSGAVSPFGNDLNIDLTSPAFTALGSHDGAPNEVIVRVDPTATHLEILFDGDRMAVPPAAIVLTQPLASLNSLTILGTPDDDLLRIEETAGGFPVFLGTAPAGHANAAFLASGVSPTNVGLHFDGDGGTNAFVASSGSRGLAYFSDDDFAANSGNINISTVYSMSFVNLTPLDILGAGAASLLIVDATSTATTTFLAVDDDVNVPIAFQPFAMLFGAAAADDGVSAIWGDGGFETVRFANFGTLILRSGTGSDSITLNAIDMGVAGPLDPALPGPNPIAAITLDGDNTTGTDSAADTLNLFSLPAAVTATLDGGDGNDTVNLGSAVNQLSGILGSVNINGGNHVAAPTVTESVTAKGQTIGNTLPIGDTLNLNDHGYGAAAQYNLGDMTFNRDGFVAQVTSYMAIETVHLNAGSAANDINVTDTADTSQTTVISQNSSDDIDVTMTGTNSILVVNSSQGADTLDVATTGPGSVSLMNGGDDGDSLTLAGSGAGSGVALYGQAQADTVLILDTGMSGSTLAEGGTETDQLEVQNAGAGSRVQLDGDSADDTFSARAGAVGSQMLFNGGSENDSLLIQAPDTPDTILVTDTQTSLSGLGTIDYAQIESLTLNSGNEVPPTGDQVTATLTGVIASVLLDGQNPAALPGDRLELTGTATHQNFEVVAPAAADEPCVENSDCGVWLTCSQNICRTPPTIPVLSSWGILALIGMLLLVAWLILSGSLG